MTSLTHAPSFWERLTGAMFSQPRPDRNRDRRPPSQEERKAERDILRDMMWSNPDACATESDLQNMLHMYPGRF
ncbi:hypothetical protein [Aliiroseovarius crassostreae]|uniref:hypothetical protein n=1 Tax=Aliiroseovarius crassostreae TaxID=154981 RepID=UPI002200AFF8|nr:hypothetical protein [Aliiroseovarius crassostreae]UWQ07008.1 hypothetical protein K3X25_09360 [Aliiroseovarius crassostreae]